MEIKRETVVWYVMSPKMKFVWIIVNSAKPKQKKVMDAFTT